MLFDVENLAEKMDVSPKIFAIGFNKTGSSSLHKLFQSLSYPSFHGIEWRSGENKNVLKSYKCFSDGPTTNLPKLDSEYREAKFILSVRNLDDWVYSRLAQMRKSKEMRKYNSHPEWEESKNSIRYWIHQRNAYHALVLSYFRNRPKDFLLTNYVRDDDAANRICAFLGVEPTIEKPCENVRTEAVPQTDKELFEECVKDMNLDPLEIKNDILCPSVLSKHLFYYLPCDTAEIKESKDVLYQ